MRVAAVGRATAAAVAEAGLNLTLVPEHATADALAARLRQVMGATARVLYPRSAMGRDVLPNELRAAGFDVLAIDVYRTLPEPNVDQRVLDRVRRGEVDVITFASPSSVRHLVALLGIGVHRPEHDSGRLRGSGDRSGGARGGAVGCRGE